MQPFSRRSTCRALHFYTKSCFLSHCELDSIEVQYIICPFNLLELSSVTSIHFFAWRNAVTDRGAFDVRYSLVSQFSVPFLVGDR